MRKFIFFLVMCISINFLTHTVSATTKNFNADGVYLMNRNEPIVIAYGKAFNEAIRTISTEAGVIIKSSGQYENSRLTNDNIETLTVAVLRIQSKKFSKNITDNGEIEITATVNAEIDTENVTNLLNELNEAKISNKNYDEVFKDYVQQHNNFDTVYGEYLNSYKKRIMSKIREGCKLEIDGKFDEALKLYSEAIDESIKNNAEISTAYIKRGYLYSMLNQSELFIKDWFRAIELDNDEIGMHFVNAITADARGNKSQAIKEYHDFIKKADVVYYDVEIIGALERLVELEGVE